MKLCMDCRFYVEGEIESQDECHHDKAETGGVRVMEYYKCVAMRAGICRDGKLFEVNDELR